MPRWTLGPWKQLDGWRIRGGESGRCIHRASPSQQRENGGKDTAVKPTQCRQESPVHTGVSGRGHLLGQWAGIGRHSLDNSVYHFVYMYILHVYMLLFLELCSICVTLSKMMGRVIRHYRIFIIIDNSKWLPELETLTRRRTIISLSCS